MTSPLSARFLDDRGGQVREFLGLAQALRAASASCRVIDATPPFEAEQAS
jgi:hypothetical protein